MSVLDGEGRVPILYGTQAQPLGRSRDAFIARPDVGGLHPLIVVAHGPRGVTSHVKTLCRHLARHGYAAMAPDLYRRPGYPFEDLDAAEAGFAEVITPGAGADLAASLALATRSTTGWASTERIGLIGLGAGGPAAARIAAEEGAAALVLAYSPLDGVVESLEGSGVPVLGLFGSDDEIVAVDRVREFAADESVEVALYSGAGHEFLDDGAEGWEPLAAADAAERMVGFFDARLTPAVLSAD